MEQLDVNRKLTVKLNFDLPKNLSLASGPIKLAGSELSTTIFKGTCGNNDELIERLEKNYTAISIVTRRGDVIVSAEDMSDTLVELFNRLEELDVVYSTDIVVDGEVIAIDLEIETEKQVFTHDVTDELGDCYLDYAMSVIIGRALPDIRDGMKPVHRRSLYAMLELGNTYRSSYKKSARVVGNVIGKYHPHGDSAVYDTIVRLAQPFSMRYPLVDGQGNFGSIDGDSPAAMRYTEVRLDRLADSVLRDLEYDTVDMRPNYDNSEEEPTVIPTRIPNLLVNGASGIAVGMATSVPPHNLNEVTDAVIEMVEAEVRGDCKINEFPNDRLYEIVQGPDFPTGGIIQGRQGIRDGYDTGRGRIVLCSKTHFEETEKRNSIVVTEIPYMVNKAKLIEKTAELVNKKRIEGIAHIRDESNKEGIRIVIDAKRGVDVDVLRNNLFQLTQLRVTVSFNMVAIEDNQPKLFNLRDALCSFINYRREVITRRTIDLRNRALAELELVEGKLIAHDNIDSIVDSIVKSKNQNEARSVLESTAYILPKEIDYADLPDDFLDMLDCKKVFNNPIDYNSGETQLSENQIKAILGVSLGSLTGIETEKLVERFKELIDELIGYWDILTDYKVLNELIVTETIEVVNKHGDARRTAIEDSYIDYDDIDFVKNESVVVTMTEAGYIKRQDISNYETQKRGGKGKTSGKLRDEDGLRSLLIANTHDYVLLFTNFGKVHKRRVFQLPDGSRNAKGVPIVNYLALDDDEVITNMMAIESFEQEAYILFATANGFVKKTHISEYENVNANGKRAISLVEDTVIGVELTDGKADVMLFSDYGNVVRFSEETVRPMSRSARGVVGMKLKDGGAVVSMTIPRDKDRIITITENGMGKVTMLDQYPTKGRAGKGYISLKVTEYGGKVICASACDVNDDVMLMTERGVVLRTPIHSLIAISRNTKGVILINVRDENKELIDSVMALQVVPTDGIAESEDEQPKIVTTLED